MAVLGIDAQLADDFVVVFTPVFDIDQRVVEWGFIFAGESIGLA